MEKIVFLILHYYTIEDTKKCIESILEKCKNNNFEIVVVDNASKNNTGIELKKIYEKNKKIHVLINDINLGFSKGNNIGFKYAKEKLNPSFIVMCNNDTYLLQNDFCEKIFEEYSISKFAVMGPQIHLLDGNICPIPAKELPTKKYLIKEVKSTKLNLFFDYIFLGTFYRKFKEILKKLLKRKVNTKHQLDINKRHESVVLHGCFWIFSKMYIDKFDGIDEKTFLYREEELLYLRLKNNSLKEIYNPEIKIFHSEYSSTKEITKTKRKKQIFFEKNYIKATKALINEMDKRSK